MESHQPLPDLYVADEAATETLAARISTISQTGDVIALWGDLGMGKTSFARGFIHAAIQSREDVPSPTFTLVQTYETLDSVIYHFDLYRIEVADDVVELGIDDAFAGGISLIEWPGNMGYWLPRRRLDVTIQASDQDSGRILSLSDPSGTWYDRLKTLNMQEPHELV